MKEETKQCLIVCLMVVSIVSVIAISTSSYYTITDKAAIEAGYSEQTVPGVNGVHWVSPNAKQAEKQ